MGEGILSLRGIRKSFGPTEVLRGISLDIEEGEFVTLLGSSGCGKTTTLRIVAGLETADEGEVFLEGRDVTQEPPEKRNVNTVFQSYALFPHMTVEENIGYGLRMQHRKKQEIAKAVSEVLELIQLPGFEKRRPSELSGGQRQRVAIARAIVNRPRVLLLDEPLGALDLQLRRQMQFELKRLQKELGISFVYITHDQEEALNMSDRIAVMKNGIFQQVGSPAEIYDSPRNAYVAQFVGSANILHGTVIRKNGELCGCFHGTVLPVREDGKPREEGEALSVALRSENVEFCPAGEGIPAAVTEKSFAAGMSRIVLKTEDGSELTASRHGLDYDLRAGDKVSFRFRAEHAVPVEAEDET